MDILNKNREKIRKICFFLLVVFFLFWVFPFINKGIDVEDTGYYLTKYKYIFDSAVNVRAGSTLFTEIFGGIVFNLCDSCHLLILNIISWGSYLISGILIYRFFRREKEDILVLGCVIIGMLFSCSWVKTFNYNALSMVMQVIIVLMLLNSIKRDSNMWVLGAGILIGINVFVRIPNVLQCSFFVIFIWYYGIKRRQWYQIIEKIKFFIVGGIIGGGASAGVAVAFLGWNGFWDTFYQIAATASDSGKRHGLENIIRRAYEGLMYGVELWSTKLLFLGAILFLLYILKNKINVHAYMRAYYICFFVFMLLGMRWGYGFEDMYAIYDMAAVFLIVSSFVLMLLPELNRFQSTIAFIILISEVILTIGTDNGWYYQCVFFMFPLAGVMMLWSVVWKKNKAGNYIKLITFFMVSVIAAYGIKYATTFVFREDAYDKLVYSVDVLELRGMKTSVEKGKALEELDCQLSKYEEKGYKSLVVLGDCPMAWAITDMAPCLSSAWPDLEDFSFVRFKQELEDKMQRQDYPVILISDFDLNGTMDAVDKYEYLQEMVKKYNYHMEYESEYFQLFVR